jgi:DNA-binding winged helix-turn-helix (wHTH) protein
MKHADVCAVMMRTYRSGNYPKLASIRFGDFELCISTRDLKLGGTSIHVEPKVFDVLVTLVLERHRVITKQELLELHWGNEAVCAGAVGQCIWSVRRALGDSATQPRFIKTTPRRGYRFVGQVHEDVADTVRAPRMSLVSSS